MHPSPHQAPPMLAYSLPKQSGLAFFFLLSCPTERSEKKKNSPTLQPLVRFFSIAFSLTTHTFQPQTWIIADRVIAEQSNINKFRRLSGASEPTPQPTKMERISASSCRRGVQGRRKIKTPELHMLCPYDIQMPASLFPASLRIC